MRANTLELVQERLLLPEWHDGPLDTPCWLYTGTLDGKGYGTIKLGGRQVAVHRIAASLAFGFDLNDSSVWVLHKCDVPRCYRPSHLYLGSPLDNAHDRRERTGYRPPNRKFTSANVRLIRLLLQAGIEQPEIAARFNVTPSTISKIATKRTYKDVA